MIDSQGVQLWFTCLQSQLISSFWVCGWQEKQMHGGKLFAKNLFDCHTNCQFRSVSILGLFM
jgi:hypothetical protein